MKEFANISPDSSFQGKKCSFELLNVGWIVVNPKFWDFMKNWGNFQYSSNEIRNTGLFELINRQVHCDPDTSFKNISKHLLSVLELHAVRFSNQGVLTVMQ